ncbi:pseudouridine synthase [Carboxydothermus pertinax]|uniref:Pseudouridine synthase n=2 Tax=Carboxydothermus pertinax TaxID=870242 RepID=A0A1L8CXE4_9THEO|nr:pseudouridine synthase [Carboxydothermus pertinax]
MKLKVKPEDFIVKEEITVPILKEGSFKLYLLEKRFWNTLDALQRLAAENGLKLSEIGYGGKKDRYGHTFQYITVQASKNLSTREKNLNLTHIGYLNTPLSPVLIAGNHFEITLRALSGEEGNNLLKRAEQVKKYGFPNYFDDQRFGSYDKEQGFFAKKLLLGHFNGALKIYLTSIYPEESREAKERKKFFAANWGNWEECLKEAKTRIEREIFGFLMSSPKNFPGALNLIPKEQLSLYFAAYQGYLYNNLLKEILISQGIGLRAYPGAVEDYLFYLTLPRKAFNYLKSLMLPTAAQKVHFPNEEVRREYLKVLERERLKSGDFNLRKIRKVYFKSFLRPAVVIPEGFYIGNLLKDELYHGKHKLELKFFLPRGSYATMLIKALNVSY